MRMRDTIEGSLHLRNMPSEQMAPIDYPIVAEGHMPSARMRSKDGRFTKPVRGTANIQTLIDQGWVIIPDPINRILPQHRAHCLVEKPDTVAMVDTPSKGKKGKKNKYKP